MLGLLWAPLITVICVSRPIFHQRRFWTSFYQEVGWLPSGHLPFNDKFSICRPMVPIRHGGFLLPAYNFKGQGNKVLKITRPWSLYIALHVYPRLLTKRDPPKSIKIPGLPLNIDILGVDLDTPSKDTRPHSSPWIPPPDRRHLWLP